MISISSDKLPQAVGPFSNGKLVKAGNDLLFTSGQLGIDPKTSNLVSDDVLDQLRQIMVNVEHLLKAGNSSLDNVVKVVVFLKDMNDFGRVNQEYAQYFKKQLPSRTCIEVSKLPRGGKIELEFIALANLNPKL